jgi:hypothetical protein
MDNNSRKASHDPENSYTELYLRCDTNGNLSYVPIDSKKYIFCDINKNREQLATLNQSQKVFQKQNMISDLNKLNLLCATGYNNIGSYIEYGTCPNNTSQNAQNLIANQVSLKKENQQKSWIV